jgi:hypothetical protein
MVAVQGENTADVDDYQLKTSTFHEVSTYTLQEEELNRYAVDFANISYFSQITYPPA